MLKIIRRLQNLMINSKCHVPRIFIQKPAFSCLEGVGAEGGGSSGSSLLLLSTPLVAPACTALDLPLTWLPSAYHGSWVLSRLHRGWIVATLSHAKVTHAGEGGSAE